jgi:hypothetical protein
MKGGNGRALADGIGSVEGENAVDDVLHGEALVLLVLK